ncbi:hypothetical protein CTI12_AA362490 [Artemisia annua]|uniref:Uncharacterized protein n=1 Tax=Artemisia annua TaxID=35608 RepID=A0A2U1MLT0_ARTAN|nr:hypothetical protein CTI12_AA362490 [Artemisia annua]
MWHKFNEKCILCGSLPFELSDSLCGSDEDDGSLGTFSTSLQDKSLNSMMKHDYQQSLSIHLPKSLSSRLEQPHSPTLESGPLKANSPKTHLTPFIKMFDPFVKSNSQKIPISTSKKITLRKSLIYGFSNAGTDPTLARKILFPSEKSESLKCNRGDVKYYDLFKFSRMKLEKNEPTTVSVVISSGNHGLPSDESHGPSPLLDRWRLGGGCDCGGWDMGCPLIVLGNPNIQEDKSVWDSDGSARHELKSIVCELFKEFLNTLSLAENRISRKHMFAKMFSDVFPGHRIEANEGAQLKDPKTGFKDRSSSITRFQFTTLCSIAVRSSRKNSELKWWRIYRKLISRFLMTATRRVARPSI